MPRVSVVVPVKDCEETVIRSVNSVLSQTFEDFELIIVNNMCSDRTIELISQIDDRRLKIIDCDVPGIVPALNSGLQAASAPLIARQDGDDFWYPTKLAKQVAIFHENDNIDICGTQIRLTNRAGDVVDDEFRYPLNDRAIKSWLLTGKNSIAHPSVVFKKDILLRVGGYDDSYPIAEDHHMWLRCIKWFNFCNLGDVLVDYNSNHNPKYDSRFPLLASEAQFKVLKHMGLVKTC
jgi:glycosyltransferase involved in cell wall biosynthesis